MGVTNTQIELRKWWKSNPLKCKECLGNILLKDTQRLIDYKRLKFCSLSCSASYNNRICPKKPRAVQKERPERKPVRRLQDVTKEQLFERAKNWQSARSGIQKHARNVYNTSDKPKCCVVCGYSLFYDVAHKRSVSDWPSDSLISDINNIANLEALCKNHHAEYDAGLLEL